MEGSVTEGPVSDASGSAPSNPAHASFGSDGHSKEWIMNRIESLKNLDYRIKSCFSKKNVLVQDTNMQ